MSKTKKLTSLALMCTLAMILSYVESLIPAPIAVPGAKIGLANLVTVFALYKLGVREAVTVSITRIILISLLFGTPVSMAYSIGGAIMSLASMILIRKLTPLTPVSVSIVGGIMHNVGQLTVASFVLETDVLTYYLPFLALFGIISGAMIGVLGGLLIKKLKINFN